jgi:N-acyl-D-glutamate deacylase
MFTIGLAFLPRAFYDIVLANGRVIDPETKFDAVRNVGIKDGRIAAASMTTLQGRVVVDKSHDAP